jgi:hypothetical protein
LIKILVSPSSLKHAQSPARVNAFNTSWAFCYNVLNTIVALANGVAFEKAHFKITRGVCDVAVRGGGLDVLAE